MTVVEYGGRIVVVDTGLMFPTPDQHGIDLVLPDFSYLRDRADDIEAIVLTHGHEDHVGALPFVLRDIGEDAVPAIYGGPLTIELVRSKLEEHKLKDVPLEKIAPGRARSTPARSRSRRSRWRTRSRTCSRTRSRASSERRSSPATTSSTRPRSTASRRTSLASPSSAATGCCCCAATRRMPTAPGMAPSESSVGPHLAEVFARCEGRIVVTSFASNIHRIQQVVDAAAGLGRKVSLVGRSMRKNMNIGQKPRPRRDPRRDARPAEGGERLPRPQARRSLDREPGRAALGPAADGAPRPPADRAPRARHRDLLGDARPRQRARRERDDRSHLRARRRRASPPPMRRSTPRATATPTSSS